MITETPAEAGRRIAATWGPLPDHIADEAARILAAVARDRMANGVAA